MDTFSKIWKDTSKWTRCTVHFERQWKTFHKIAVKCRYFSKFANPNFADRSLSGRSLANSFQIAFLLFPRKFRYLSYIVVYFALLLQNPSFRALRKKPQVICQIAQISLATSCHQRLFTFSWERLDNGKTLIESHFTMQSQLHRPLSSKQSILSTLKFSKICIHDLCSTYFDLRQLGLDLAINCHFWQQGFFRIHYFNFLWKK